MNKFFFLLFFLLLILFIFYIYITGKIFRSESNTIYLVDKNIILISVDTLRADHLGIYGYYRNTSPHIDHFARESIVFEQAFATSSYTLASHVSLFTGLYPKTHKVFIKYNEKNEKFKKTELNTEYKTLAEYLSFIGYQTLWMVATNNEQLNIKDSEGRGFKTEMDKMTKISKLFRWIEKNPNEKFFAFLHTSYTHDPYYYRGNAGDKEIRYPFFTNSYYEGSIIGTFYETFKRFNKKYKIRITEPKRAWYNSYYNKFVNFWWSSVDVENPKDIQRLKDLYDDSILYVDYYVGLLINYLKTKKIYEKTIIILVSDHGEAFGEHGKFRHMTLHKEILHVPLIVYIPGFKAKRIKSMVSLIDVYPTILDLIEEEPPHEMDGKSLLPLIKGNRRKIHNYIISVSEDFDTSITTKKWKLIKKISGDRELYDIVKDPYERKEISEKHPHVLKKLDQKIDMFLEGD